jgi:hypothetical protein
MSRFLVCCYFTYLLSATIVCYQRPIKDDFDRYIYEGIVRQRYESWETSNAALRNTYSRLQESTVANSPELIAQIEPFYAIKPLYLTTIGVLHDYGRLSLQNAIRLISAASMFGIGTILFLWARRPLLCALIASTQPITLLGRLGTPDAFSTVFVVGGCYELHSSLATFLGHSQLRAVGLPVSRRLLWLRP